jgi:hypothetical protein
MRNCIERLRTGRCAVSRADQPEHGERLQRYPNATLRSEAAHAALDWLVRQLRWEADLTLLEREAIGRELSAPTRPFIGDTAGRTVELEATPGTVRDDYDP